ncbi:3-oxoadipyl-CoA thiolase [Roseovarius sp. CH_XMU1461]|uniref:3-oxoadipyl-CoA thiolase n=1 Tax=Roseovarius sp. CH_XMU1461 TaxID=3107777 RepID=UPI00300B27F4
MAEVFVCDYIRTPIGRYGGALAGLRTDDLAAHPIRALMARQGQFDWAAVDEVILGCANQAGEDNRNVARMAVLLSGLPESVPALTLNRLCGSGMDAVMTGARAIRAGEADVIVAGGVESMSRAPLVMPKAEAAYSRRAEIYDTTIGWRFVNPAIEAQYGIDSMPETAENVAEACGVSRADQDAFALASQERALAAQASGRFAQEIAPVSLAQRKGAAVEVDRDEHPRETSLEKLASLPTPFRKGGTVTAGNASGVNDGAAALILASEAAVKRHGLTPLARIEGGASAGLAPRVMGLGPVPATERLCARLGITAQAFDLIELNEAFAAQAIAVLDQLGLDWRAEHINRNGGAIALGHPLGMSGARLVGSLARDLAAGHGRLGLASMCVGVGQGVSLVLRAV